MALVERRLSETRSSLLEGLDRKQLAEGVVRFACPDSPEFDQAFAADLKAELPELLPWL